MTHVLLAKLHYSPYVFYGTNAYWIHMLSDTDMDTTFHDIATAGLSVVRTWAFNDVAEKPSSGTYFQVHIYVRNAAYKQLTPMEYRYWKMERP